jgi:dUTP pyrophosphatase
MKVKVKFDSDEVKNLYLKASDNKSIFPFKTYESDFCYDVVATSCKEIAPNVYKYGWGVAFQIERDGSKPMFGRYEYVGYGFEDDLSTELKDVQLSIDFRPRSSIWRTGMSLSNCEGTIDEGYINNVSAVFYHLMPNMPKYEVGDKIGQIKIGVTLPISFIEVDDLDNTERGLNGYGSTGK